MTDTRKAVWDELEPVRRAAMTDATERQEGVEEIAYALVGLPDKDMRAAIAEALRTERNRAEQAERELEDLRHYYRKFGRDSES